MAAFEATKSIDPRAEIQNHFMILRDFPLPDIEKAWRDCLTRVEFPAHYNSPEFFREPYWAGKRPFAVLALDHDRVVGVLTGLHEGKEVVSGLKSRPQVCVDMTADTDSALKRLARGLLVEASSAKLVTVYSWSWMPLTAFQRHGFHIRQLEGNVVLDLTQGAEALFRQFPADRRRNIRFSIRQGVEVFQATTTEDFQAYYDIYLDWAKRKGNAYRPFSFQVEEAAFRLTQANRRLFLAWYSGKVIAGNIFRFFPDGLFESARNNSLAEYLHLKPNDLLQWRGIEWACSQGFRRHSLGGAHVFLRRFGGTVVPVYRYQLDRTWFRHHRLAEVVLDWRKEVLRKAPRPVAAAIQRLRGK